MIEHIEQGIINFLDKKHKGAKVCVYDIYEEFYLNLEHRDLSIGVPGYFKGWVRPVSKIFKEYGLQKLDKYWIKRLSNKEKKKR